MFANETIDGVEHHSSNKIRKTQNEHLNSEHHLSKLEQSVIVNLMPIS